MKKILTLALLCSVGMSYAAKERMVTLTAREVEMVQRAQALENQKEKQATMVAKYAQKIAQGNVNMAKEEHDPLMRQVMFQLAQHAKLNRVI